MCRRFLAALTALGALLVLTHCGQTTTSTTASGTFSDVYANTISTDCQSCHSSTGSAAAAGVNLNFTSQAAAYSALTSNSVSSADFAPKCPNVQLVVAGNPANSYLMGTLFSDYFMSSNFAGVSTCANYQHQGLNLSPAEEASMKLWILNQALNN